MNKAKGHLPSTTFPVPTATHATSEASPKRVRVKARPQTKKPRAPASKTNVGKVANAKQNNDKFLTTCPTCNCKVRADRLEKHLRKAHEHVANATQKTKPRKASKVVSSTRTSSEVFSQSFYDTRDATKDYAHAFRENGRYGSHPMHDDYSDEGWPD